VTEKAPEASIQTPIAVIARQTFAAWAADENRPPDGAYDGGAWRQAQWARLREAIEPDPETWWLVALEAIRYASPDDLRILGLWPFRVLLAVGGEPLQQRAVVIARDDPKMAAILVEALEDSFAVPGQVWSGMTEMVRLLGLETAIAAAMRHADRVAAIHGDDADDTPDFWAFDLGGRLARNVPELAWAFVTGLIAGVSEPALDFVGAGELENFCWVVGATFIERIEAEAECNPRFRRALGSVWPGNEVIPADTYRRIRAAAGFG
jgi:hypothetical protein